jgi:hypothetical protein
MRRLEAEERHASYLVYDDIYMALELEWDDGGNDGSGDDNDDE